MSGRSDVISVRFAAEDADMVRRAAVAAGVSQSEFVRLSAREAAQAAIAADVPLTDEELAALKVNPEPPTRKTAQRLIAEAERHRLARAHMTALVAGCCGPLVDRRVCESYGCGTLQDLLNGGDGVGAIP